MSTAALGPLDETITIADLTRDPYPIYKRLRREAPVLRVKSVGRTFLTKAADTKYVKDNAALFSSNDPNTPMKRAFLAHHADAFSPMLVVVLAHQRMREKARFMGVFGSLELNNAALSFTYLVSAAFVRNVRPTDLTRNTGASRLRLL